jgi:hypothetical protein
VAAVAAAGASVAAARRGGVLPAARAMAAAPSWGGVAARALSTNPQESFMSGSNSVYVEEMYRAWLKDRERCVIDRRGPVDLLID